MTVNKKMDDMTASPHISNGVFAPTNFPRDEITYKVNAKTREVFRSRDDTRANYRWDPPDSSRSSRFLPILPILLFLPISRYSCK